MLWWMAVVEEGVVWGVGFGDVVRKVVVVEAIVVPVIVVGL